MSALRQLAYLGDRAGTEAEGQGVSTDLAETSAGTSSKTSAGKPAKYSVDGMTNAENGSGARKENWPKDNQLQKGGEGREPAFTLAGGSND